MTCIELVRDYLKREYHEEAIPFVSRIVEQDPAIKWLQAQKVGFTIERIEEWRDVDISHNRNGGCIKTSVRYGQFRYFIRFTQYQDAIWFKLTWT